MCVRPEVTERVEQTCDPDVVHFLDGRNVHAYIHAVSTPDKTGSENFNEPGHSPTRPSHKGVTSMQLRMRIRGPVRPTSL
ncbi:hypothetical protein QFZ49_006185 [Streptomyces turgidiscabies]|uniref:Transposase n=1 Tax=Streptomyces turgidiscabies TaxID=85558 RepID=A0ABU0RZ71_9ACTN|nr:hypothetical protein [Streptomyces turgidiscabies]